MNHIAKFELNYSQYDNDVMKYINMLSEEQKIAFKNAVQNLETITEEINKIKNPHLFDNYEKPKCLNVSDIEKIETDYNITLPLELKVYLLTISSGTFKHHLGWQEIKFDYVYVTQIWLITNERIYSINRIDKLDKIKKKHYNTNILTIRSLGCGWEDFIILDTKDGQHIGEVWEDGTVQDEGYQRISESFFDYTLILY